MKTIYESETLESTTSTGARKFWRVRVLQDSDGTCYTQSEAWQQLGNNPLKRNHITSVPTKAVPKNVGKANETTPAQQARSEADSDYDKKIQKGYHPMGEERPADALALPMLAHKFGERSHNVTYPCFVQPKLDGIRMLFDGSKGWSRQGNVFLEGVTDQFRFNGGDLITLDGELILPAPYTFQETTAAVKKVRETTAKLEYHVYDIVDPSLTFTQRLHILRQLAPHLPENIKMVLTMQAANEAQIDERMQEFVLAGYEGAMVRNAGGMYKLKDRSVDLLKVKEFIDEEFKIVDIEEGAGSNEGCAVLVLETPQKKRFNSALKMTVPERRAVFEARTEVVGQMATIRYQNLSDDGVPRFPVAIAIRDYE